VQNKTKKIKTKKAKVAAHQFTLTASEKWSGQPMRAGVGLFIIGTYN